MTNKDEIMKQDLSDEELDAVAGGGIFSKNRKYASDGHEIGCTFSFSWYEDENEANYKTGICSNCGGKLTSERVTSNVSYKLCTDCGRSFKNEW
jgi:hypothetical protein